MPGQYGEVCQVPSQVSGGTVITQATDSPNGASSEGTIGPVLVSQPAGSGGFFRGSRFAWRRPDPESSLATTRVEGGLDDTTVTR
jgi:hypothetical protein